MIIMFKGGAACPILSVDTEAAAFQSAAAANDAIPHRLYTAVKSIHSKALSDHAMWALKMHMEFDDGS